MRRVAPKVLCGCLVIGVAIGAYARGDYLLGWDVGIAYALVAVAVALCVVSAGLRRPTAPWPFAFAIAGAVVVGLVLFYPASVNSDVDIFIQKQADDRSVRSELYALFESDPQYSGLSLTTWHAKVVVATVSGVVQDLDVVDELATHLKVVSKHHPMVVVDWELTCRDSGRTIDTSDWWRTQRLSESSE